ncbi:hypothetical protein W97_07923 [Coniosporium apollinis CBS 100218]|uniref:FAD-binding PCMH-type domain-containing protein n=1 Tax=Coniosporium apollinis (strain CBS 100218) TaxID=1168221 RepID=R7Z3A8_CONA1|nr:uncharacterized protein W97_07923 [Coniosporium apollinis CBS 100218]EON68665.1 hypothetical protein W97_07923 [Coniosporium apollinis CBS 100218]
MSALTPQHINDFHALLPAEEVIGPSSPLYKDNTLCWAYQKDLKPALVLCPTSLPSLQATLKYLSNSELDFAIRSGGCGSSSAKDVILSMSAFNDFTFNAEEETVLVGAGQTWGDIYRKMESLAPGFAVVGARTPYVGVGGSILSGGISWLSHEFGLAADPQNMLDAQLVLLDGRVVWASEEPALLWALRGGGGNFGALVAVRLKCYQYTDSIYSGSIYFPIEALEQVSVAVSEFANRPSDPKMAMHVFLGGWESSEITGEPAKPPMSIMVYDAHGEAHGRSEQGFKWALNIPGAVDETSTMTLRAVGDLQEVVRPMFGALHSHLAASIVQDIDPDFLLRAWNWLHTAIHTDSRLGAGTFVLLEIMQEKAFGSAGANDSTAWPHSSSRHILQLLTGFAPGSGCSDELALKLLETAPGEISSGRHVDGDYFPNFLNGYMQLGKVELAGLNKEDVLIITGQDYPTTFSHEIYGIVTKVGADARGLAEGDCVVGFSFDRFATFQRTSAYLLRKVKAGENVAEMLTLLMAYSGALHALTTLGDA